MVFGLKYYLPDSEIAILNLNVRINVESAQDASGLVLTEANQVAVCNNIKRYTDIYPSGLLKSKCIDN